MSSRKVIAEIRSRRSVPTTPLEKFNFHRCNDDKVEDEKNRTCVFRRFQRASDVHRHDFRELIAT